MSRPPSAGEGTLLTGRWGTRTVVTVAVAVVASLTPTLADQVAAQEDSGSDTEGDAVVEIAVDVASANDAELVGAIDDLNSNVLAQLANLDTAQQAVRDADRAVEAADAAVAATEIEIADLTRRSDAVVVQAFVAPPSMDAIDALASESAVDAAVKQTFLDIQADTDANVLGQLADARERLEEQRQTQRVAVGDAEQSREDAESALDDVVSASSQQVEFLAEVEERLEQSIAEADALEDLDPEMAERLRGRYAELVEALKAIRSNEALQRAQEILEEQRREEAEEAARAPDPVGPASGSLATVPCPSGGEITIDSSLERNLRLLLDAAAADGYPMCGGGYRSYEEQVQLRRANCGPGDYAIYEAPASYCSPPTARPGTSNHETGLAIDFTSGGSTISCGEGAHDWLEANAERYGLYQLPSECWHWSTDGT